jgi:hypothetical protein
MSCTFLVWKKKNHGTPKGRTMILIYPTMLSDQVNPPSEFRISPAEGLVFETHLKPTNTD